MLDRLSLLFCRMRDLISSVVAEHPRQEPFIEIECIASLLGRCRLLLRSNLKSCARCQARHGDTCTANAMTQRASDKHCLHFQQYECALE